MKRACRIRGKQKAQWGRGEVRIRENIWHSGGGENGETNLSVGEARGEQGEQQEKG